MVLLSLISFLVFSLGFSQEVNVYAIVKGAVKKVYVKEGQRVKKDQPLVEINPDLYLAEKERLTAQLEAQRLKLEKTERDFKRYEELYNRGLLSKSEYEDWKNRYERERATYLSLEAELKGVEKHIEYCQIRAPTSGVVKKVFVRERSFINGTLSPHLLLILSED
jgi:multidrug efflux system membrane fusion protein